MSTLGMCLTGNSPAELGEAMINRRIQGKSWQEIADEFSLGSPSAARAKFKKLTGITDFKIKGAQLDKLVKNNLLDQIKQVTPKVAKKAVGQVDDAMSTFSQKFDYAVQAKKDALAAFSKDALGQTLGGNSGAIFNDYFSDGVKSYLKLSQKYNVPIKDIDEYIFRQLVLQADGDIWKAYVLKPTSEFGFAEVKGLVFELRSKGWTQAEIVDLFGIPKDVVKMIMDGMWSLPQPGSFTFVSAPAKKASTPITSKPYKSASTSNTPITIFEGPIHTGTNFGYPSEREMLNWINSTSPSSALTDAQRRAIKKYTGGGYTDINDTLRYVDPDGAASDWMKATWKELDSVMEPIPKNLTVTRFVNDDAFPGGLETLGGTVFSDAGYFSTSIKPGGVFAYKNVKMIIDVPAGTKGRWVSDISSVGSGEQELLLARNTHMIVTKVEKVGSSGYTDNWVVHATVVAS